MYKLLPGMYTNYLYIITNGVLGGVNIVNRKRKGLQNKQILRVLCIT